MSRKQLWYEINCGMKLIVIAGFCSSWEHTWGHLNVTWRGGAHFLRISTTFLGKNCISIPCFGIIRLEIFPENNRENNSLFFFEQIVMTCLGIFDQFLLPGSGI